MYYDDNYGFYEIEGEDPDEIEKFYRDTQRQSVEKKCEGCGRMVKIKKDYAYCNRCADMMEKGGW